MALHDADGNIRVTVVDGNTYVGLYAPDQSLNVVVDDGEHFGVYHPSGAIRVSSSDGLTSQDPSGALYLNRLFGVGSTDIETFIRITTDGNIIQSSIYASPLVEFNGAWYAAYVRGSDRFSMIAKSTDQGQTWTHAVVNAAAHVDDAHYSANVGVDSDGYLHYMYNMHAEQLRYKRSTNPEDITAWTSLNTMGLAQEDFVTYPRLYRGPNNGILYCTYRYGTTGSGSLIINKYDTATETWSRLDGTNARVLDGTAGARGPYEQNLAFDGADDDIYLTWTWREALNKINEDVCFAWYDQSAQTWYQKDKTTAYTLPITRASSEVIVDLNTRNTNVNGQVVDTNGDLHVVFASNDALSETQIWHTRVTAAGVVTTTQVTNLNTTLTDELSDLGRPSIFEWEGDLYVLFTNSGGSQEANFAMPAGFSYLVQSSDGLTGATWNAPTPLDLPSRFAEFNIDYNTYETTGVPRIYAQSTADTIGPVYVFTVQDLLDNQIAAHPKQVYARYGGTTSNDTDLTNYSFTNRSLGAAAANRKIVVFVGTRAAVSGNVASVTVAGIAATRIPGAETVHGDLGPGGKTEAWIADVPTGTTGTIAVSGAGTLLRCAINHWSIYDGEVHAVELSTVDPSVITISVPDRGAAVGFGMSKDATTQRTATWTNMFERADSTMESATQITAAGMRSLKDGDKTFTCDWSGTPSQGLGVIVVSFEPEAE